MDAVGGYFELADLVGKGRFPHRNGVLLNTGRNALEYILRSIGEMKRLFLPYYTCEVVLEPLRKLNIPYSYYHINTNFEITDEVNLKEREYIIANNYFGVKGAYIQKLAEKYGDQLIVDCAQAFFAKTIPGIKTFYSMRKYVGVADGGVAYLGNLPDDLVEVESMENTDDHDSHLFKRKQFGAEAGFAEYQDNEKKLDDQPIRLMSFVTKWMLNHIDYDKVVEQRRENYLYLFQILSATNQLQLPLEDYDVPMVYPYLTDDNTLKERLIAEKIFVATYWSNIFEWCKPRDWEYTLAERTVFLPVDQRYGREDMKRIIELIG